MIITNKTMENKTNNALVVSCPNGIKTYYKASVIKRVGHWDKNRQIDQWKRIKKKEIDFMGM